MDHDIAMKWADALESGEYKQTQGRLYDGKGYCCLGVLCDLVGLKPKYFPKAGFLFDSQGASLPNSVLEKTGITSTYGCYPGNNLTNLNDVDGKSFPEIAEVIREHWEEL